ncbi:MAG TPA: DsrE/DsrF/DrsH-like family protein [Thermoanaerobaculia bacterium]
MSSAIEPTKAGLAAAIAPAAESFVTRTEPTIADLARQIEDLKKDVAALNERAPLDKAAIIVFSGDLDHLLASLVLATGAAAAGLETTMFFTFWGLSALKKKGAGTLSGKTLKEKMFALMTPGSTESLGVSQMNFFGIGASMMRAMMKEKDVTSLEEMMDLARELGVKRIACTMSMDVMGVDAKELDDDIELGGVAAFMAEATRARVSLFV